MKYDVIVIGAGIVGLATALKILEQKPNARLLILEKEIEIAKHQTGNNSGVIHSGLYYKPGSLKALNCTRGYNLLLHFCKKENVQYELCGKIVVATHADQLPMLETLFHRGTANGLTDLRFLESAELREIEPHVAGIKGIYVPQTGIINYTQVCEKYVARLSEMNASILFGERVSSISEYDGLSTVVTNKGSYDTSLVVNCGGLYADKITQMTEDKKIALKIIPFRGEYYELKPERRYLVKNLIYPVPDPSFPFLGVHFTRMINGGVEAGPNAVLAFKREGYRKFDVDASELSETLLWPGFQKVAGKYWKMGLGEFYRSFSKRAFVKALQQLIPEITADDLQPGGAGVRAQACDIHGVLLDDFAIIENNRAINVCNAPSPAATSSLSIGETVANKVLKRLE